MKKILLSIFTVISGIAFSQNCSDLFISEYVEGLGNNKAIEIYNPTPNPIDLLGYRLIRWDNGSVPPIPPTDIMTIDPSKVTVFPSITIAPFDVIVIGLNHQGDADPTLNTDLNLVAKMDTFFTTDCNPSIVPPQPRTVCFNGDDAIELQKSTSDVWKTVDIFGVIGERPTNNLGTNSPTGAWTALSPYFTIPANYDFNVQGPYFKQYWTQKHTLIRKPTVLVGILVNPQAGQIGPPTVPSGFNPAAEWDSLSINTFDSLGAHTCDCATSFSIHEASGKTKLSVYPNPVKNQMTISSTSNISRVELINITGQTAKNIVVKKLTSQYIVNTEDLLPGIYIAKVYATDGSVINKKIIKE